MHHPLLDLPDVGIDAKAENGHLQDGNEQREEQGRGIPLDVKVSEQIEARLSACPDLKRSQKSTLTVEPVESGQLPAHAC